MIRPKVAVLLTSEPNFDEFAFKYFLLCLNKIQNQYEFSFQELHSRYFPGIHYLVNDLFSEFTQHIKPTIPADDAPSYFINIITPSIENNLFFECRGNVSFITTYTWDKIFSPPSLFEYLLHCIIASLLFMNPGLDLSSHRETRGCCLDYTYFKNDDRVDILLGYICDNCREKISSVVTDEYLSDIVKMMSRDWIGDINTFESVAYNLKKYFKFNINKDSGFNKTTWERIEDYFYEIPQKLIIAAIGAIIGAIVAIIFKK